jgi:fatty-acyl-CoA synthase
MSRPHYRFWPKGSPKTLDTPATTLHDNLAVSAARYPDKPAIVFHDSAISYGQLKRQVDAMAGYLQFVVSLPNLVAARSCAEACSRPSKP